MVRHGSNSSRKPLNAFLVLAALFGIILAAYKYLKSQTTLMNNKSNIGYANTLLASLYNTGINNELSGYMVAQSAHETNGWTSDVFKNNNNAFGMMKPDLSDYYTYTDVQYSALDIVNWYTRHRNNILSLPLYIANLKDYVNFLKRNNYFTDSEENYFSGCQYWYTVIFTPK